MDTSTVAPGLGDLLGMAIDIWKGWGTEAFIVTLIAVVNLLVNVTKFGPVGRWMADKGLKWIRPALATLLGALIALAGALASEASVLSAVLAGIAGGLGSAGFHELTQSLRRKRELAPAPPEG